LFQLFKWCCHKASLSDCSINNQMIGQKKGKVNITHKFVLHPQGISNDPEHGKHCRNGQPIPADQKDSPPPSGDVTLGIAV
ncbi:hypothetical protein, partial [Candidatus Methylomirabilis limnetica]|uniref:hypothetical protein n=1 Tax=Candidatus Methylomirabilis limnetica TaxID=2033718 RepID=UPI00195917F3